MAPHSKHPDYVLLLQNLVHKAVLNVNSPRICTSEVADQFLERRWALKWIDFENLQQLLGLQLKSGAGEIAGVLLSLLGEAQNPAHQRSSVSHSSNGVAIPSLIDAAIPGIDSKYSVS